MNNWKKYLLLIFLILIRKNAFASNSSYEKSFRLKINEYRKYLFSDLSNKKLKIRSKHHYQYKPLSEPNIEIKYLDTILISSTRNKKLDYSGDYTTDTGEIFLYKEENLNFSGKKLIIEAKYLLINKNASICCENFVFLGDNITLKKGARIYISENFVSLGSITLESYAGIHRFNENDDYNDKNTEKKSKLIVFNDSFNTYKNTKDEIEFSSYIMFKEKKNRLLIK